MSENVVERKIDRTGWPQGEWDSEPDREEWRAHGLPCLIVRNDHGSLCGYVGVPPGHPLHGKGDDDCSLEVHGGITYANACRDHICHVPRDGEPEHVWWLGFDCGHAFDFQPGLYARLRSLPELARARGIELDKVDEAWLDRDLRHGTYRPMGYVREQVERLAEQCAALGR